MIYLDNAASTRPDEAVLQAMADAARELYANPSSAHALGAAATRALESARRDVAEAVGAEPAEIVFTSGGTEADALGVLGAAGAARGRHVVVTALEHPAVRRSVDLLVARGFSATAVRPLPSGIVRVDDVVAATTPDTAVVAVMLVNNELGTVQPVPEITRALKAAGLRPHVHVDAVQALGLGDVDVRALAADSLAVSAHKLHGPKGAGALWLREGARLQPLWDGGRQERGLRSGTENLPGALGFARAAVLARQARADGAVERIAGLRDALERRVFSLLPDARSTVAGAPRAPHIASVSLPGLPAEPLLHALEARGVVASAGSACASRTRGPSATLKAVGVDDRTAVLRFSCSRHTTPAEIETAALALRDAAAEVSAVVKGPSPRKSHRP